MALPKKPQSDPMPSPGERTPWVGVLLTVALSAVYLGWLLLNRSSEEARTQMSDLVGVAGALAGLVWSLQGIRKTGVWGRSALPCNLLSLGMLCYVAAEGLWSYLELIRHESPFPSWADAAYVGASLLMLAGVLLSPSRPLPGSQRMRVLLDSLMTLAAVITFSWFFYLGPTVLQAGEKPLAKILEIAYPILDLAMLFSVVILTAHPFEKKTRDVRNLIGFGVLVYIVADVAFAYVSLTSEYTVGPIDAGWLLAALLIGQGTHRMRRARIRGAAEVAPVDANWSVHNRPVLWRSILPYALVPAVAALLAYVRWGQVQGALADGVYVGTTILVGLILLRQLFAMMENARLYSYLQSAYRDLEALATTDGMTGLPNHRSFQERLRACLQTGSPVSLLLIDVDHFKSYNDSFGHPAGDGALKIVASLLKSYARPSDLPARYGGEEFALLLPATEPEAAARTAEAIRAACEAYPCPHRSITLSIGVASAVGGEPGAVIERADRALYEAKRGGRNAVRVAEEQDELPLAA